MPTPMISWAGSWNQTEERSMAGHSKWKNIQHRKSAQDAKRGKVFTKLIKELTIAARLGGDDPDANPRLRAAIANARSSGMPKDNIERAVKKGAGELEGEQFEEILYEGYGPHNVAVLVEAMTDNRNRTIASVRHAFSKNGGNLGTTNSVQYMFDRIGEIRIAKDVIDEDRLTELVLDAGAEDIETDDAEEFRILTSTDDCESVRSFLEEQDVAMRSAGLVWNPQNRVEIDDPKKAEQVIRLIDMLEEDDDVQSVHSNFDVSEDVIAQLG